jgi:hypothetical protein
LQARDESAGKVVLCPACQQRVTVPDASVEPPRPREQIQTDRRPSRAEDEIDADADDSIEFEPSGSSGKAMASLILGILSLFCNVLTGIPGVIAGILALRDIRRSRERLTGRGLATAGIITACVGTLLSCVVLSLGGLMLPAVSKVRDAAARAQTQNNLKQLILAMQNYNDTYNQLPGAAICDKTGKPLLSWRVALLPYIEQQGLYNQFKLDEPWDGPNNIKLLAKMPKVYLLPGDTETPADRTHYQVFVGKGAAFELKRGYKIPGDFPDGTSNTILIAEVANAVPWTKPEDVPFDPRQPMLPLMSNHFRAGFHVGMGDGSVRAVVPQISEATFIAAITRNGRERLGPDW